MADFDALPNYDDVIADPQPSAPQPGEIGPPSSAPYYRAGSPVVQQGGDDGGFPRDAAGGTEYAHRNASTSKVFLCIQRYTNYSMAHHLRKYIIPKHNRLDPELDVEAQFSRRTVQEAQSRIAKGMRKQCITGWLWCFGFLQVLLYILLPIGMLIAGIAGFDECNSKGIIIYLLLGGALVVTLIATRSLPSIMTCCRNRNYFNTGTSKNFTGCICAFELVFYLVALANFVVLIFGTIWIFDDTNLPSCSSNPDDPNCCAKYVYSVSAFFNIFQYIMYSVTLMYIGLVVCCVRNMDKIYGSRE